MNRTTLGRIGMVGVLGLGFTLAACNGGDETPPAGDGHGEIPAGQQPGMEGMQRHAQELGEMTDRTRQHIQQMRQLFPEQQHERMGEHVAQVSQMLGLVNRQMREMDMGMGMTDEQMGQMMGMTGEEHRRMMNDVEALRADVEQLQTASLAQVRQRMPEHLNRLERTTQMLEESAQAMRSM